MLHYQTIRQPAKDQFTEKKSVFIGQIAPVQTEEEALAFVGAIKKLEYNATHNVFAYRLRQGGLCRCSDDGEPQGTAGLPVLEVMAKQQLVNVAIVATRYFGGTMLGAGGLVRAYTKTAALAVRAAEIVTFTQCVAFSLDLDYGFYGGFLHFLEKQDHVLSNTNFGERILLDLLIPEEDAAVFAQKITERSAGLVRPTQKGLAFAEIKRVAS